MPRAFCGASASSGMLALIAAAEAEDASCRRRSVVRQIDKGALCAGGIIKRKQAQRLPALVDGRMKDGRGDVDRVAGAHDERRFVVDHLLANSGQNVEDFFGLGMIVTDMALSGQQN